MKLKFFDYVLNLICKLPICITNKFNNKFLYEGLCIRKSYHNHPNTKEMLIPWQQNESVSISSAHGVMFGCLEKEFDIYEHGDSVLTLACSIAYHHDNHF